jgi:hypothetical protein
MDTKTTWAIVGLVMIIVGIVFFFLHTVVKKKIEGKKLDIKPLDHQSGESPSLWVGNQMMGTVMFGQYERESAPFGAYAMYNCFMLLWLPIIPLGCYLATESYGRKGNSYRVYCELKMEGKELLDIYLLRWGIGLAIIGAIVLFCNLS